MGYFTQDISLPLTVLAAFNGHVPTTELSVLWFGAVNQQYQITRFKNAMIMTDPDQVNSAVYAYQQTIWFFKRGEGWGPNRKANVPPPADTRNFFRDMTQVEGEKSICRCLFVDSVVPGDLSDEDMRRTVAMFKKMLQDGVARNVVDAELKGFTEAFIQALEDKDANAVNEIQKNLKKHLLGEEEDDVRGAEALEQGDDEEVVEQGDEEESLEQEDDVEPRRLFEEISKGKEISKGFPTMNHWVIAAGFGCAAKKQFDDGHYDRFFVMISFAVMLAVMHKRRLTFSG